MMTVKDKPDPCPICGYYLTTAPQFAGCRCIDPAHWQAAGVLSSRDYYPMAKIASGAHSELNRRPDNHNMLGPNCS